jgi:hypothetical protein
MRRLLRRAVGTPAGRRLLLSGVLAIVWAAWAILPPRPLITWDVAGEPVELGELAPDGSQILSLHVRPGATPVRLSDMRTGRTILKADLLVTWGTRFGPAGRVVVGDRKGRMLVWSAAHGLVRLSDSEGAIVDAISPDGRILAANFSEPDPAIHLWDTTTGRLLFILAGARWPFAFSPNGRTLAFATTDPATPIRLWDVTIGRETARFGGDRVALPLRLAFSPDGGRLAAWPGVAPAEGHPRDITVWDLAAGKPWATLACPIGDAAGSTLEFSPNGRLLIARDNGPGVFWDLSTDSPRCLDSLLAGVEKLMGGPIDANEYPLFSADGSRFVVPGDGDTRSWIVYDAGSLARIAECVWPYQMINGFPPKVSPDGRLLAQVANAQFNRSRPWEVWLEQKLGRSLPWRTSDYVLFYDLSTGAVVGRSPSLEQLLGFAPDGRSVWTCSNRAADGEPGLRVWQSPVPPWRPPWWLIGATVGTFVITFADWRWGRRTKVLANPGREAGGV